MENQDRMNMDSKEKRNNYIYILKALAIFSVICAHATRLRKAAANGICSVHRYWIIWGHLVCRYFSAFSGICSEAIREPGGRSGSGKRRHFFCHGSAVRHYCGSMWCSGRVESVCLHGCCSSWDIITRHIILQY